jgi:hypothetical protein
VHGNSAASASFAGAFACHNRTTIQKAAARGSGGSICALNNRVSSLFAALGAEVIEAIEDCKSRAASISVYKT